MKRLYRWLSPLLAAATILSMSGITALAADPPEAVPFSDGQSQELSCAALEGCDQDAGVHSPECPLYEEPADPAGDPVPEDAAPPEGEAEDETELPAAVREAMALIDALPEAEELGNWAGDLEAVRSDAQAAQAAVDALDGDSRALLPAEQTEKLAALAERLAPADGTAPLKAPVRSEEPFELNGKSYASLEEAIGALTQSGQTITLTADAVYDNYTLRVPYDFTLTSVDGAVLTAENYFGPEPVGSDGQVTITLRDISLVARDTNDGIRIEEGVTLVLEQGAEISSGETNTGTLIQVAKNGTLILEDGSGIRNSYAFGTVQVGDSSTGGNFIMNGGVIEIQGDCVPLYLWEGSAEINGGSFTGNAYCGVLWQSGNVTPLKISGNPDLDNYTTNIRLSKEALRLDLTGLGPDAQVGITLGDKLVPTGDSPVAIADISGTEVPAGVRLDAGSPYELKAGEKLDAGILFAVDSGSESTVTLRGNGTENDPYLVASYEEMRAAVNKINNRSQMGYIEIDGSFAMPESYPYNQPEITRIFLSGKLTLSASSPDVALTGSAKSGSLFLQGNSVELVLRDITIRDGHTFVDTYGSGDSYGTITVEDGTVFTGFESAVFSASECDVVINGGTFRDCSMSGNVISTDGDIYIRGGVFEHARYIASTNWNREIVLSGDYTFENSGYDFQMTSGNPIRLAGPLASDLVIYTTSSNSNPILTADDPAYLQGWENRITCSDPNLQLISGEDGKSLVVKGSDRLKVSIPRYFNDSKYGTLPMGTYYNAGTNTSRGTFYISGIKPVAYNGYDLDIRFTKARMTVSNLVGSDGKEITDDEGYIVNWTSPDLEYYVQMHDGTVIEGAGLPEGGALVQNIPGEASSVNYAYISFKGNDQYLPCRAEEMFNIYAFEASSYTANGQSYQLAEGVTVKVLEDAVYTGEETLPKIEVKISNKSLFGGAEQTLVEGVDYVLQAASEEDWQAGENRLAYLRFQGNYGQDRLTYPNPTGYFVYFDVAKGSLSVEDCNVVVSLDNPAEQSVDLSALVVTPEQESYTCTLGSPVPDTGVVTGVAVVDGQLKFTPVSSGEVTIPVTVESANAQGTAHIVITVTDRTSGPVALTQSGQTFYFDSLNDALRYAADGDVITLSQVQTENVRIDKAVVIDGGKTGGISGTVLLTAPAVIREADLSGAAVTLAAGAAEAVLTPNYWNSNSPSAQNGERDQVYPYYQDAAMTVLVQDPAPFVRAAITAADELIYNESETLISLKDISKRMDEPEVQKFLREHQAQLKAILDELEASANPDALEAYLAENPGEREMLDMLLLAYDVACRIVPQASAPDTSGVTVSASTEAGQAAAEDAKESIASNEAVSGFVPVFGSSVAAESLPGVTDTTLAIYLKLETAVKQIEVQETTADDGQGGQTVTAVISSVTFDVTPQYSVDNRSNYQVLSNDWINGSVTFRLPVPDSVTAAYARVTHAEDADRYLTIQTEEGHKYVQLSASSFSPFVMTFVNSLPDSGHSSGSSGSSFREREYEFWMEVKEKILQADPGDTVKANARSYDRMPWSVMAALAEQENVTLHITWNGGEDILIPSAFAVNEAQRVYYPLAYLEGMDFGTAGTGTPDKVNPATGGILEITAPADGAAGMEITDPHLGLADNLELTAPKADQTGLDGAAPETDGASESGNQLMALIAGAAAVLLAGTGGFIWLRRRNAER